MLKDLITIVRRRFADRQPGQGVIEYAIIMAGVSTATTIAIQSMGQQVSDVFKSVGTALGGS